MSKKDLYTPSKIVVGFRNRPDTFTGKLAYVTYDREGKRKNEKSWTRWIDDSIPVEEFDNVPMTGFLLNKGVKRINYMNFGSEKFRIYDVRGIEFEISAANMVSLLQYCEISKGEIQQECIYAWINGTLNLLSVNSDLYAECVAETNSYNAKHSVKLIKNDLVVGSVYASKRNTLDKYVYMGKRDLFVELTHKHDELKKRIFGSYYRNVYRKEPMVNVFAHLKNGVFQDFVKCEMSKIAFESDGYDIQELETDLLRRETHHNNLKQQNKKKYLVKKITMQESDFCDWYLPNKHTGNRFSLPNYNVDVLRNRLIFDTQEKKKILVADEQYSAETKDLIVSRMDDFINHRLEEDLFVFFVTVISCTNISWNFREKSYNTLILAYTEFKEKSAKNPSFGTWKELFSVLDGGRNVKEFGSGISVHSAKQSRNSAVSVVFVDDAVYDLEDIDRGFYVTEERRSHICVDYNGSEYIKIARKDSVPFKDIEFFLVPVSDKLWGSIFSSFPESEKQKIIDTVNKYAYWMIDNPTAEELDNPPDGYQVIEI